MDIGNQTFSNQNMAIGSLNKITDPKILEPVVYNKDVMFAFGILLTTVIVLIVMVVCSKINNYYANYNKDMRRIIFPFECYSTIFCFGCIVALGYSIETGLLYEDNLTMSKFTGFSFYDWFGSFLRYMFISFENLCFLSVTSFLILYIFIVYKLGILDKYSR